MNPLKKLPSLGTVHAGSAQVWIVLLMLTNAVLIITAVLALPYLVIIRSAWSKSTRRAWRTFIIASTFAAIGLTVVYSPLFIPTVTSIASLAVFFASTLAGERVAGSLAVW